MGIFIGRKKESLALRKLTEREIQEKLYGHLTSQGSHEVQADEVSLHEKVNKVQTMPPQVNQEQPVEAASDLFVEPVDRSPAGIGVQFSQPVKPSTDEFTSKDQIRRDNQESVKARHQTTLKASRPAVADYRMGLQRSIVRGKQVKRIIDKTVEGIHKVLSIVLDFSLDVSQALIRFFWGSRHLAKRIVWFVFAMAFVFVLFSSVHFLNMHRERAMKNVTEGPWIKEGETEIALSTGFKRTESSNADAEEQGLAIVARSDIVEEVSISQNQQNQTAKILKAFSEGQFVIQVATYVSQSDALRISNELMQSQWPSFVKESKRPGGREFYLVYLGNFSTFSEAQEALAKFRKSSESLPFKDAFVRTLKD